MLNKAFRLAPLTSAAGSLLNKAFRLAPLTSAASIAYGLEHAPKFTISLLNGLLFAAATDYHAQLEDQDLRASAIYPDGELRAMAVRTGDSQPEPGIAGAATSK